MNITQAQQKALDDAFVALRTVLRQEFEDLLIEHDILSFIRDLRHSEDITYFTDVNVDYLHQPWRAFATVINKCLSGKETGMDKIRLSRAQILWDAKKTNKMAYPRFTKIIIDYFMSKDQSISRRNKMFWHTTRDDTVFTSMRCIYRHEDTQVYGTILPKELTNQAMLESKDYQTYYAFVLQRDCSKYKGTRTKVQIATVAKTWTEEVKTAKKTKAKGLAVLSEVMELTLSQSEKESWGDSEDEDEDDENDSDDISDEGDDDNDGNNGNDGDDDNANDDDKQEGDDTNNDDEETDSDRTEPDNQDS
ncbi:hypothetical protein Tco_0277559 [Tanacetum coccineum]